MSDDAAKGLPKNQLAVLAALTNADAPMSAYDILDALKGTSIRAPAQVYRALDKLAESGRVHRVESLNAFVACAHDHTDHPDENTIAFAICDDCGAVTEIPLDDGAGGLPELARRHGFTMARAVLELHGECAPCQAEQETVRKILKGR